MPILRVLISDLGEYLRPVDVVIVFPSEECLLLSDWEVDQVLMLIWKCQLNKALVHDMTLAGLQLLAG